MTDFIHAIQENLKAVLVATGAVGVGVLEHLDVINGVLALVSISLGIVVAGFVIRKHRLEYRILLRKENDRREQDRIA